MSDDRGFGRYLDQDRRTRPRDGADVDAEESNGHGIEHEDEHRPPPRTGGRLGRSHGRDTGFGRYLPD